MKTLAKIVSLTTLMLVFAALNGVAQRVEKSGNHNGRHNKVVVVKRGNHHRVRVAVYHPRWAPRATFAHRWVFFPYHNFYWDNVRAVYVYKENTVWVTNAEAPASLSKVDLEKEKHVELTDADDSNDSVEVSNDDHLKAYGNK